jgi:methyltransferase (TIGR00027 family)
MEAGHPSKTALLVAGYRARATARPAPVCDDPWAEVLAGDEGATLTRDYDAVYPPMELWVAVRTAFIDARVRRATSALGARQVVVLGAGFDTRAARLAAPGVRFFEVDRQETQAEKLGRLGAAASYPIDAATYVACDFESQDFVTELGRAGFSVDAPALVVWEGVTPYLTEPAIRATLRRIASGLAKESVVVFDHLRRKIVAGEVKDEKDLASRDFVGDLGEPLRFGVDDVLPLLYEEGFRRVRTLNFDEACLAETGTYERERKFRFQGLAIASRGAAELP